MAKVWRIADGKAAIWDGAQDALPFTDPLNNLSRVKFHTLLDYIKIIDVRDFTLNIPALGSSGSGQGSGGSRGHRAASYTLGAHGRPGQPFIIGEIVVSGVRVAFTGSVPVHQNVNEPYARFVSLGVDATNVIAHEYATQAGDASTANWATRPAQSFAIRVYITDILL